MVEGSCNEFKTRYKADTELEGRKASCLVNLTLRD